jgi:hypothetical protein
MAVTSSSIDRDPQVQRLLDRVAIEDCLVRYCHAVDRCDPELLRGVYWPEATDDHVFWVGGAEAFVEYCMPFLRSRDQTMHTISSVLIRFDGNEARVQCYYHAYERVRRKNGTSNDITFHGRYLDRMEKRGEEWRIADRKVMIDWWRIWEDSADWTRGIFGHPVTPGKRGSEDPAAALFGDLLQTPYPGR